MFPATEPPLVIAFAIALLTTAISALAVCAWLFWRARGQQQLQALAGFGLMMALWCTGHFLILTGLTALGSALVLANPLMPTFFLHFSVRFVNQGPGWHSRLVRLDRSLPWIYGLSLIITLWSWSEGAAVTPPWLAFPAFFQLRSVGWVNMGYSVLVGVLAHGVLIWGFLRHRGNLRRSIVAMFLAAGLGLAMATSFIMPSLGIQVFPYPMLLLPGYVILLIYGVLRYHMIEANIWANRALLWLLLMLILLGLMSLISVAAGRLGLKPLGAVPGWQLWLYSVAVLTISLLVYRPVSGFVRSLVYPGSRLSEYQLEHWLRELRQAGSWSALEAQAEEMMNQLVDQPVAVRISPSGQPIAAEAGKPTLSCRGLMGEWDFKLDGWQDFVPGQRLNAEVFGSLLASTCAGLEQSLRLAETQRRRLAQQHLVELGELSAALAHELRNPLNIIAMATADCDGVSREHIQTQLERADHLIQDMLAYSGRVQVNLESVPLQPLVQALTQGLDWQAAGLRLSVPAALEVRADPHRLQQVLINLLDNARAFVSEPGHPGKQPPRIEVEATQDRHYTLIRIHNNGPPIAAPLRQRLFQPFISKRAGGSGLGLAIVRRIMEAHGGQARHRDDLGWPCSFEVQFLRQFNFPEESE